MDITCKEGFDFLIDEEKNVSSATAFFFFFLLSFEKQNINIY